MLELTNLHKTFAAGTPNEKKALKGLSLNLDAGDFVTVPENKQCSTPLPEHLLPTKEK